MPKDDQPQSFAAVRLRNLSDRMEPENLKILALTRTGEDGRMTVFCGSTPNSWLLTLTWEPTIDGEHIFVSTARCNNKPFDADSNFYGWYPQFGYALNDLLSRYHRGKDLRKRHDSWLRIFREDDFRLKEFFEKPEPPGTAGGDNSQQ